jgi:hypothetical protein
VHYSFLPKSGYSPNSTIDPTTLKHHECVFSGRLHEVKESDHWWNYGANEADADAGVAELVDLYKRRAASFFARFEPFPDVFERINPEEIDAGDHSRLPADMSSVGAALTLARIMNHLGRKDKCRQFADIGLRHLGGAVGLRQDLELLRDTSQPTGR